MFCRKFSKMVSEFSGSRKDIYRQSLMQRCSSCNLGGILLLFSFGKDPAHPVPLNYKFAVVDEEKQQAVENERCTLATCFLMRP